MVSDAQHGVVALSELAAGLRLLGARGVSAIRRVMSHDDPLLANALDFGGGAVVIPMVTQAQGLTRSVKGTQLATEFGDQEGDQGAAQVFGMLERREAVERSEDFETVEGLGGFFLGPSDLALAWNPRAKRHARLLKKAPGDGSMSLGATSGRPASASVSVLKSGKGVKAPSSTRS